MISVLKTARAMSVALFLFIFLIEPESAMAEPAEFRLDNGVTVVYEKVPGVKVVSVQAWIKTGSVNETPEISGISHFLEHILFKGTKNFKPGEIDSYLDARGGRNNAFTSTDVTNYYVTIPTAEAEAAFNVISDMVFEASFIPDEIEKEKPVVLQEINRKYDDPSYKMWQDLMESLFRGTPYEMQVIGKPETVESFTREKLLSYYNKFYHPKNIVLVVVGDINKEEVSKLAKKYFSKERDITPGKRYEGENKVTFIEPVNKVFEADVNVEYAVIGFPEGAQDLKTVYADEVLSEILSGGEYSLLNQILKIEKDVVVYVDDISMFNKYNGVFGIFAVLKPGGGEAFKKEALIILKDVASGKIDPLSVEKAKNRLKSQSVFQSEKVSSLANDIGFAYVLDMKDYYLNYLKGISAVSVKDVADAAKRMTAGPMYFGETVPKGFRAER